MADKMKHPPFPMEVCADEAALAHRAAGAVVAELTRALEERGRAVMALAGGSTPRDLYTELVHRPRDLDWSQVWFVWGDERCVPPDDKASNVRMATESLLEPLEIKPSRIIAPRTRLAPAEAAHAYEITLRGLFEDLNPCFDLILLGMGADGHTASLFPGGEELDMPASRLVTASRAPSAPHDRVTLTLPVINRAQSVLFVVKGRSKASALQRVRAGDEALPAARVRPSSGRLLWLVEDSSVASDEEG